MKKLIIVAVILSSFTALAGGFRWPNVPYHHAKLHLFNIPFKEPAKIDYYLVKDGAYAKSKIGEGYVLDDTFLKELHAVLARGVDELIQGLSGCYIPRHGIIYYNEKNEPVAAFSVCLECEKIDFWSSRDISSQIRHPHGKLNIQKAEYQIKKIKELFVGKNIPVYDKEEQYEAYLDSCEGCNNLGEMNFSMDERDTLFNKPFTIQDIWGWMNEHYKDDNGFKEEETTKITAGGDKYTYKQIVDKEGSKFVFNFDEQPKMIEATIVSNKVILPNGLRVGMSLEDIQNQMLVYDGISWPAIMKFKKPAYTITYHIARQTITKIEMVSK
ncbi:hypothetical protein K6119_03045 [Paracrocinitomix mangrovi]|uniref:hypothetical protein n=1 Tax=Paracrocinitomix mangrovi TaxID=2862509 RepID=UPI001C8E078F|nr:hypothetical protein [Paracrocinitomix mangrovi]UKN02497.1 hypothetical protein K6119_03045 [Paracrocinitomix mangrovi]